MGARQHSTRALAAFDRLLPSQMETAVFIPPMLATRLEDPRRLADARYIAEPKLDGQRVQLHVRGHRTVCAFSRPGRGMIRLPGLAWLRDVRWLCLRLQRGCGVRGWERDGLGTGARGRVARARRALMSTTRTTG
jgi:hypothetical protein